VSGNEDETDANRDIHLFCININTRYLVVMKLLNKSKSEIIKAIQQLYRDYLVTGLKGDGERGFMNLGFHTDSSPYTFHNKVVDRVIRTIRDQVGYRRISEQQLQQIVNRYNNTYHRSIDCTPLFMQQNPDIEDQYIRWNIRKLDKVDNKLSRLGFYNYTASKAKTEEERRTNGDLLLLHLDESKTANKYRKKRGYWNQIGRFIQYVSRSACEVYVKSMRKNIVLPLYFTMKVDPNVVNLDRYELLM
jgi:hypothetical protein